jgi:hypothetical protein
MGVQPPSNEIEEEPDVIEFGIAALDARLEELDVSFPADADHLRREYGTLSVPVNAAGTEITLADALSEVDRREFDEEMDLRTAGPPVTAPRRETSARSASAR